METGLRGKKCLITGGNTGIGLGISKALAREGVELAVAGLNPEAEAMAELERLSGKALFLKTDVSQESEAVKMVRCAIECLGGLKNRGVLFLRNSAAFRRFPNQEPQSLKVHKLCLL